MSVAKSGSGLLLYYFYYFSNPAFTSLRAESPLMFLSLHKPAQSHNTTNFPHVNHIFLQIDIKDQTNQPD